MRVLVITAALLLAAPASAAAADLVIEGRGWGHGVGLSQWGAQGYATREARDHAWILNHYYPGTGLGRANPARIRVLLKRTSAPKVCGATAVRDAAGRRVRLSDARTYVFRRLGPDRLRVVAAGRTRARLRAPVTVTGGSSTCLRGEAENGVSNGAYRGQLVLVREG